VSPSSLCWPSVIKDFFFSLVVAAVATVSAHLTRNQAVGALNKTRLRHGADTRAIKLFPPPPCPLGLLCLLVFEWYVLLFTFHLISTCSPLGSVKSFQFATSDGRHAKIRWLRLPLTAAEGSTVRRSGTHVPGATVQSLNVKTQHESSPFSFTRPFWTVTMFRPTESQQLLSDASGSKRKRLGTITNRPNRTKEYSNDRPHFIYVDGDQRE
jgi:hypothetical protein